MYRITRYYCLLKETEIRLIEKKIINEVFCEEEVGWFV